MIHYYLKYKYGPILYDTDQEAGNWKFIAGKGSSLIAIGAGLLHFNENPVVISIFIVLLILLILFLHYESIVVFGDRFVYVPGFSIPWKKPYLEFQFKDLQTVISPGHYEVQDLPRRKAYLNEVDPRRKIHILYKNNSSELYSTSIPWGYLHIAGQVINKEIVRQATNKVSFPTGLPPKPLTLVSS